MKRKDRLLVSWFEEGKGGYSKFLDMAGD